MSKRTFTSTQDAHDTSSPTKRPKTTPFQPLAIAKIGYTFNISALLTTLRTKKGNLPWHFGIALGMVLY